MSPPLDELLLLASDADVAVELPDVA